MKIVLVTDTFPPQRSSGAIQLRDLALEFVKLGYDLTVMVPESDLDIPWQVEEWAGVRIIRLQAPKTIEMGYVERTKNEFLLPFVMLRHLRKSPLYNEDWDGVVWYSPTIFFGPLVHALKRKSHCRGYLIIRDIFPEWALDLGLLKRGLPYLFFKAVATYQYFLADVIGVQTAGNLVYFDKWRKSSKRLVHVLPNWLADASVTNCSIAINQTVLVGRKIFVYAGNMGIAQGMDVLIELADSLKHRQDIGFVFVGRGSETNRLRQDVVRRGLDAVLFFDEIDPSEIPGLYAQCHVGLVVLDRRHKTHNIPGKFLSYMQSGLPVLAQVNANNDLVTLIETERVGRVGISAEIKLLQMQAEMLMEDISEDSDLSTRCRQLARRVFSPRAAVTKIMEGLN